MSINYNHRPFLGAISIALAVTLLLILPVSVRLAAQESPTAATPAPPPPPPVLLSPSDGSQTTGASYPPLGMPTFSWSYQPEVAIYRIQVSNTPGFSTFLVNATTYAASYTPTGVWVDGPYYWRVQGAESTASNASWSDWSNVNFFTKDWTNSGTIKPTLLKPENGATRSAFQHGDFSWTAILGAAGYLFQISTDDQFNNIAYSAETLKPEHTPSERLANTVYYWRVTPFAYSSTLADRVTGTPSDTSSFTFDWSTAPTLVGPANLSDLAFVPRFQWTAVEAAKEYVIQISTSPAFSTYAEYSTRNTDFTPSQALSNDQEYYWRVKAVDQQSTSTPWSEVRRFRAKWNFVPTLLTPANNQTTMSYPFFSWAPIPGAERYQIQIDDSNDFATTIADVKIYNTNQYAHGNWATVPLDGDYMWRVRGVDAQGNYTPWSETRAFQVSKSMTADPIYPLYYYAPDASNLPVHRDLSIRWPVFVWDAARTTALIGGYYVTSGPDYYRLLVDNDSDFSSPIYAVNTATEAWAPTTSHAVLQTGIYYWRVEAYLNGGIKLPGYERYWVLRVDANRTAAAAPDPLRPSYVDDLPLTDTITPIYPLEYVGADGVSVFGAEAVETPPVLGWQPVRNAASYHIQIGGDENFTTIIEEAHTYYVNYVPGQEKVTRLPTGTYWWRVAAESASNNMLGTWSAAHRFNLSRDLITGNPYDYRPPEYDTAPPPPSLNQSSILSETAYFSPALTYMASSSTNTGDSYELGDLHMMLDRNYRCNPTDSGSLYWVIAFEVAATPGAPLSYWIYVDANHAPGLGASSPPSGAPLNTNSLYAPEYALRVDRNGSTVAGQYYAWANTWSPATTLESLGGCTWYAADTSAVQVLIPYTALGGADDDFSGSLALAVYSTQSVSGDIVHDTVPSQGSTLDNPLFVTDMLMPLFPFNTPLSDPIVHYHMPAMRWRVPTFDSVDGYEIQVARDARFSDVLEEWNTYESLSSPYFGLLPGTFQTTSAYEDNTSYYWRVRIRHEKFTITGAYDRGPWSPPMRFRLSSREVSNPALSTSSVAFMTPTFTWDRAEGAAGYAIQVDDDANFSSPLINEEVDGTSYTPRERSSSLRVARLNGLLLACRPAAIGQRLRPVDGNAQFHKKLGGACVGQSA